ncbi:MAG UNVERIFIED_CONTAM: NAD(P)/FAD-dependent oxidoreductase [Rickettsiaceae bacterium]|jgi:predicted flavoprotein YhiN
MSNTSFEENILFTHRGLSGPAILQISSYLEKFENEEIIIDLLPSIDLKKQFIADKNSKKSPSSYLKKLFGKSDWYKLIPNVS